MTRCGAISVHPACFTVVAGSLTNLSALPDPEGLHLPDEIRWSDHLPKWCSMIKKGATEESVEVRAV